MEEDDLYVDLPHYDHNENLEKLQNSNQELQLKVTFLTEQVEKLTSENTELRAKCATLSKNISSIMKTARAEISRKDNRISDLNKEIAIFRTRGRLHRPSISGIEKQVRQRKQHDLKIEERVRKIGKSETKENKFPGKKRLNPENFYKKHSFSSNNELQKSSIEKSEEKSINTLSSQVDVPTNKETPEVNVSDDKQSPPKVHPLLVPKISVPTLYSQRMFKKIYNVEPSKEMCGNFDVISSSSISPDKKNEKTEPINVSPTPAKKIDEIVSNQSTTVDPRPSLLRPFNINKFINSKVTVESHLSKKEENFVVNESSLVQKDNPTKRTEEAASEVGMQSKAPSLLDVNINIEHSIFNSVNVSDVARNIQVAELKSIISNFNNMPNVKASEKPHDSRQVYESNTRIENKTKDLSIQSSQKESVVQNEGKESCVGNKIGGHCVLDRDPESCIEKTVKQRDSEAKGCHIDGKVKELLAGSRLNDCQFDGSLKKVQIESNTRNFHINETVTKCHIQSRGTHNQAEDCLSLNPPNSTCFKAVNAENSRPAVNKLNTTHIPSKIMSVAQGSPYNSIFESKKLNRPEKTAFSPISSSQWPETCKKFIENEIKIQNSAPQLPYTQTPPRTENSNENDTQDVVEALFGSPLKWTENSIDEMAPKLFLPPSAFDDSCSAQIENTKFKKLSTSENITSTKTVKGVFVSTNDNDMSTMTIESRISFKKLKDSPNRPFEQVHSEKAESSNFSSLHETNRGPSKLPSFTLTSLSESVKSVRTSPVGCPKYQDSLLGYFDDTTQLISALAEGHSKVSPINTPIKENANVSSNKVESPVEKLNIIPNKCVSSSPSPAKKPERRMKFLEEPINILLPRRKARQEHFKKTPKNSSKIVTCNNENSKNNVGEKSKVSTGLRNDKVSSVNKSLPNNPELPALGHLLPDLPHQPPEPPPAKHPQGLEQKLSPSKPTSSRKDPVKNEETNIPYNLPEKRLKTSNKYSDCESKPLSCGKTKEIETKRKSSSEEDLRRKSPYRKSKDINIQKQSPFRRPRVTDSRRDRERYRESENMHNRISESNRMYYDEKGRKKVSFTTISSKISKTNSSPPRKHNSPYENIRIERPVPKVTFKRPLSYDRSRSRNNCLFRETSVERKIIRDNRHKVRRTPVRVIKKYDVPARLGRSDISHSASETGSSSPHPKIQMIETISSPTEKPSPDSGNPLSEKPLHIVRISKKIDWSATTTDVVSAKPLENSSPKAESMMKWVLQPIDFISNQLPDSPISNEDKSLSQKNISRDVNIGTPRAPCEKKNSPRTPIVIVSRRRPIKFGVSEISTESCKAVKES